MMPIDRAFVEWDDGFRVKPTKGRVGKLTITKARVFPGTRDPVRPRSAVAARARLAKLIRKAPEVMVKVSGGGRGMSRIKAHFDYISRNGDVLLEDEKRNLISGKEAVRDLREEWKYGLYGIPEESTRKEAFNIVLSMPPGTDRAAVTDAARAFAGIEFSGNHQYVFATHDDERHPHVHLCVKSLGIDGTRLNPRKADLQRWRERFADALCDRGIDANATPRRMRGSLRRTVGQASQHSAASRSRASRTESPRGPPATVVNMYGKLAMALAAGNRDDRALAVGITSIVAEMTSPSRESRTVRVNGIDSHGPGDEEKQSSRRVLERPPPSRER